MTWPRSGTQLCPRCAGMRDTSLCSRGEMSIVLWSGDVNDFLALQEAAKGAPLNADLPITILNEQHDPPCSLSQVRLMFIHWLVKASAPDWRVHERMCRHDRASASSRPTWFLRGMRSGNKIGSGLTRNILRIGDLSAAQDVTCETWHHFVSRPHHLSDSRRSDRGSCAAPTALTCMNPQVESACFYPTVNEHSRTCGQHARAKVLWVWIVIGR
jgi:hypothetical protein